ncbi:ATP-binding cassette domain-containing protein [Fredinandcohnia humi]
MDKDILYFLIKLFKRQKALLSLYVILATVSMLIAVLTPMIFGLFIDRLLVYQSIKFLIKFLGIILIIGIAFSVVKSVTIIINNRLIIKSKYYLSNIIRDKIHWVNKEEIKKIENGNLTQVITNDLASCQLIFNNILNIILESLSFVMIIVILVKINIFLPIIFSIIIPIYLMSYKYFSNRIYLISQNIVFSRDKISKVLEDIKINLLSYKQNPHCNEFDNKYNILINDIYHWQKARGNNDAYLSLFNQLMFLFLSIGVLFFGGYLVIKGSLTVGLLTTLLMYSTRFFTPIEKILNLLVSLKSTMVSVRRVYNYYKLTEQEQGTKNIYITNGDITIINYRLPKSQLISATFSRGQLNFITGSNGIGKSTLINSICKVNPVDKNTVFIDETDVFDAIDKDIHEKVFVVFQGEQFLGNTIREQLKYTSLKSQKSCISEQAKKEIQSFIKKRLSYYDLSTKISALSGGQKQDILLISALNSYPEILILDESFSFLDDYSTREIYNFLRVISSEITVIIITHNKENILHGTDIVLNANNYQNTLSREAFDSRIKTLSL